MRLLIASDSFKGTLTSSRIADIYEEILSGLPGSHQVVKVPLADGGEGSTEALVSGTGGEYRKCRVSGPLGTETEATYGILGDRNTAVMEMAEASGITLVPEGQLNPLKATSRGTGQMIRDALESGCRRILICIGGSATNDGGIGMLAELGVSFADSRGNEVPDGAEGLERIASVSTAGLIPEAGDCEFLVACDVDNPLLGERGATRVYGPQKGADAPMLDRMESGMANYAAVAERDLGKHISTIPGAGAAGGLGAALVGFLNAKLQPGFPLIAETLGLDEIIRDGGFTLIVTGEGMMNSQTLHGKLPLGVARLGRKHGVPVVAVVGSADDGIEALYEEGLVGIFPTMKRPMDLARALERSEEDYRAAAESVCRFAAAFS